VRWVDSALSIGIALLIFYGALQLILEITLILMEGVPRHIDVDKVSRAMGAAAGVVAVHDLHIWTISSGLYALSAHLVVPTHEVCRNDEILETVKARLRREFGIEHTTLQIESVQYAHLDDPHVH
jgi:cobalt-zinc-cadmium efflux system protein